MAGENLPYYFQKIAKKREFEKVDSKNVAKATKWYREAAGALVNVKPSKMMESDTWMSSAVTAESIGRLIMFFYDPKHKEKLPYYDTFPLVFPMQMYEDGFLGVNLHYVYPFIRASVMDYLYEVRRAADKTEVEKIVLSYGMLKSVSSLKRLQPCIKRYLFSHVRSKYMYVAPQYWDAALYLPTERFKKANKNRVWAESSGATA